MAKKVVKKAPPAKAAKTKPASALKKAPAVKAPAVKAPAAKAPTKKAPVKSTAKAAGGKTVEWSYLRANCKTCEKAEAWLGKSGVAIGPRVDARKETINAQNGLKLARTVDEVRVAKGNAVTKIDMKKGAPGDAELSKLIIGPTGNLRAPSLKHGKTLVVGFNDQLYGEFFQG
ncbi:MAG: ArsC family (seleno)protein [Planctomycetota bacterium]